MSTITVDEFPRGFNLIIDDEELVHLVPGDTLRIIFPSGKYLQIIVVNEINVNIKGDLDNDNIL